MFPFNSATHPCFTSSLLFLPRESVEQDSVSEREKGVRQAPTHAPAPYMHPIHSYLLPVTRWLQNGIDY